MSSIAAHCSLIKKQIAEVAHSCERNPEEIALVAVSKTKPVSDIVQAIEAGQFVFGENYVQEGVRKIKELQERLSAEMFSRLRFHFIGALQRNKVRDVVGVFSLIHSVDRIELAKEISKEANKKNATQDILVQVNVSREESKNGVSPVEVREFVAQIISLPGLSLRGLMSIGSNMDRICEDSVIIEEFKLMKKLREDVIELCSGATELSMGMSSDFKLAIAHGATIVRVGSLLFGERIK